MIGSEYFGTQLRLVTVVAPVAIYFLILGLLNSRKHPQLITGRRDVVLLMAALSPLLILPAMDYLSGACLAVVAAALAAIGAWAMMGGSADGSYVVYNLSDDQARRSLERTLSRMGIRYDISGGRIDLPDHNAFIEVSSFRLLRNVSIRVRHGSPELCRSLSAQLGTVLQGIEAQTSSMAVGLLMVAAALLVAPMVTVVHRAPEIVRVLTDLLH